MYVQCNDYLRSDQVQQDLMSVNDRQPVGYYSNPSTSGIDDTALSPREVSPQLLDLTNAEETATNAIRLAGTNTLCRPQQHYKDPCYSKVSIFCYPRVSVKCMQRAIMLYELRQSVRLSVP